MIKQKEKVLYLIIMLISLLLAFLIYPSEAEQIRRIKKNEEYIAKEDIHHIEVKVISLKELSE